MVEKARVMVAMSGGVDSAVTAALLRDAGHEVAGVFLILAQPDAEAQAERAARIAARLGLPFQVLDLAQAFRDTVLAPFRHAYFAGRTPNPCVACNPGIKFGRLLEFCRGQGADFLATGHYARLDRPEKGGPVRVLAAADPAKDQTYFLCRLQQEQFARVLFPLGGLRKPEVYGLAARLGLSGWHGAESQDVCFLQGRDLASFLIEDGARPCPGDIVAPDGTVIGRHRGVCFHTVGQRRGLGIPDATPYYVVRLDPTTNRIVAGKEADLWQRGCLVRETNWTSGEPPAFPLRVQVRIRSRHRAAPAVVTTAGNGRLLVAFDEPQRAITPGQFAVFYHGEELLGGGEIETDLSESETRQSS